MKKILLPLTVIFILLVFVFSILPTGYQVANEDSSPHPTLTPTSEIVLHRQQLLDQSVNKKSPKPTPVPFIEPTQQTLPTIFPNDGIVPVCTPFVDKQCAADHRMYIQ